MRMPTRRRPLAPFHTGDARFARDDGERELDLAVLQLPVDLEAAALKHTEHGAVTGHRHGGKADDTVPRGDEREPL